MKRLTPTLIFSLALITVLTGCAGSPRGGAADSPDQSQSENAQTEEAATASAITSFDGVLDGFSGLADKPNSASGVGFFIRFTNADSRTIKYVVFSATPFNAVGDSVGSSIGGKQLLRVRLTGPIEPGALKESGWKPLWYNGSITSVEISAAEIEYIDGSTESIELSSPVVLEQLKSF
jgi:hypothetical protein